MRQILGIIRILVVFITIVGGVLILSLGKPVFSRETSNAIFYHFKRFILWVVGIRIHGEEFEGLEPGLIVANHRSYLDAIFVPTKQTIVMVAKQEVKNWPLIGMAATTLGTIWVKRENKESRLATRGYILNKIQDGERVVLFPEGTSWEGPQMLPLKPAMFYEAADHGFPIYQWSLHFDSAKTAFPIGINFVQHLWTICTEWRINAYIRVRKMPLQGTNGDILLEDAKTWWKNSLAELDSLHPATDSGYWPDDRLTALK